MLEVLVIHKFAKLRNTISKQTALQGKYKTESHIKVVYYKKTTMKLPRI